MKQQDTWWLPAGVRNTGINNFTKTLGIRSLEIVERFNNDPIFTDAAGKALIALYDDKAPAVVRSTMENIKKLMGERCFMPDEAELLAGLQHREVTGIPKLTGCQIEKLEAFLRAKCPIIGTIPAAETHILFPQPSMISGSTFGIKWTLENARKKWGIMINVYHGKSIPDRFFNRVRSPQWILMFWGPEEQSAVPHGTNIKKLSAIGYEKPDLAVYALALGYMRARGIDIRPRGLCDDGTAAALLDGLYVYRTIDVGLNISQDSENKEPALIRRVPFC